MKNERRRSKSLSRCQHFAIAAERTHCLDSSQKLKRFESQPLYAHSPPPLSLCLSSSPPLVTPQTESFLDGFPKLSGVRREALTQHCPLCMHGSSWVQPRKGLVWGGRRERRKAAALELWLRLYGKSQSQQWPRVSNNFCFLGKSEGGRWIEETDRCGNTERVIVIHLTHRTLFSAHTS